MTEKVNDIHKTIGYKGAFWWVVGNSNDKTFTGVRVGDEGKKNAQTIEIPREYIIEGDE